MKTLHVKCFLLAAVIIISFLVAIPSTQALPQELTLKVTASHQDQAQPPTFDITIAADLVNQLLEASTQESLTKAMDEIRTAMTLTDEQKLGLLGAKSIIVAVEPSPGSYAEIQDIFWVDEFPWLGTLIHFHLCDVDAANAGMAIGVISIFLGIVIWELLTPTVIGVIAAVILSFEIAVFNFEYWHMYQMDMNADKSFDVWTVIRGQTYWFVCQGWMQIYTPHYRWRVTPVGAWIDGRQSPPTPASFHQPPRYGLSYGGAHRL